MSDPAAPAAAAPASGDLAALAVKAFASNAPAVAAQAAASVTPSAPAAPAPGAKAPAAGAPAKMPATLLSETPVAAVPAKDTAAAVAAEAAKAPAAPEYKLAIPESGRLTAEHVAQVESFAKSHGMTEAQAKQVLARDDLNVAQAFDTNRDELLRDPTLGGARIDATIATTKSVLAKLFTPEERKLIASMPLANSRMLHGMCAKIAAMLPSEDVAHSSTPGQAAAPISAGQAMYPHLYQK